MLIDTTLREGAQMFGVRLDVEARRQIALGLAALGVEEIEAGWVGLGEFEAFYRWCGPRLGGAAISIWSRCREDDIREAARLGVRRVNIGVPASDGHRQKRLDLTRQGLLCRMETVFSLARAHGMEVSVGLEDASRAAPEWLVELALAAEHGGAFRVRLSDTVGVWTPVNVMAAVAALRGRIAMDIAVHCHNDFGMGTANAISALGAGAEWADGSLLGIGERSGLAATEELAGYLELMAGARRYTLDGVRSLCKRVAVLADLPLPRNKAVAGDDIFACESGVHLHGMARDPNLFEPYPPDRVQGTRRYGFSAKSGRRLLGGLVGHDADIEPAELLERVGERSGRVGRPLTMQECIKLFRN